MTPIALYAPGGRIAVWRTPSRLIVDADDRCVAVLDRGIVTPQVGDLPRCREQVARGALEAVTPPDLQDLVGGGAEDHQVLADALHQLPMIPRGPDAPDESLHLAILRRIAGLAWVERRPSRDGIDLEVSRRARSEGRGWATRFYPVRAAWLDRWSEGDRSVADSIAEAILGSLQGGENYFCVGSATQGGAP